MKWTYDRCTIKYRARAKPFSNVPLRTVWIAISRARFKNLSWQNATFREREKNYRNTHKSLNQLKFLTSVVLLVSVSHSLANRSYFIIYLEEHELLLVQPECVLRVRELQLKYWMISPTMKNNRLCFASNSCLIFFTSLASNGRCKKNGKRFSCFDVHFDAINTSFENCSSCFVASVVFFSFYFSLHLTGLVLLYPIEPSKNFHIPSWCTHNIASRSNLICFVSRF